jgi:hypothetical protein
MTEHLSTFFSRLRQQVDDECARSDRYDTPRTTWITLVTGYVMVDAHSVAALLDVAELADQVSNANACGILHHRSGIWEDLAEALQKLPQKSDGGEL